MSGQTSTELQTQGPLVRQLSGRLKAPVSDADRMRAGLHLMDWAGCAVAGRIEPAGRILLDQMERGAGGRAFGWGGLGNILEMDDVDKQALLHPGPSIMAAALATSIEHGACGDAVLDAVVRGYEATIRLGRAVGRNHYALWHSTGTCSAIGAAAACASLLRLDTETTAHAIALAVSQSAGLWQTRHEPQSMGKQLHCSVAARAGLDAARLAAAGFRGPLSILEGPQGFFAAMCPGADPASIMAQTAGWRIHEVSFKPWPACRHAHAAIDAALALRETPGLLESGGEIIVETYRDALVFCDKPDPETVIEAKFSLQHAVAVTLLRGHPALEDFSLAAIADEQIVALRRRVKLLQSSALDARYPSRFGASVRIGEHVADIPDALGDPENPVSNARLREKSKSLMTAGGLSPEEAESLVDDSCIVSAGFLERIRLVLA